MQIVYNSNMYLTPNKMELKPVREYNYLKINNSICVKRNSKLFIHCRT